MNTIKKKIALASTAGAALLAGTLSGSPAFAAGADFGGVTPPTSQIIQVPQFSGSATYGSTISLNATGGGSGNPIIATTSTPQTCVALPDSQQLHLTGVGSCTVTFNQDAAPGYAAAQAVRETFAVKPAGVHLVSLPASRAADEPNPPWNLRYIGLVNGDGPDAISLADNAPGRDAPPGYYEVWGTGVSANYTVARWGVDLTINPVVKLAGLPADVRPTWTLNHSEVDSSRAVLPYGSTVDYTFIPTRWDENGTLYITTGTGFSGRIVASQTAWYTTMQRLVDAASGDPRVRASLKGLWYDVEHPAQLSTRGTALHRFADLTRSFGAAGIISGADSWNIVRHAQVVYTAWHYDGTV